MDFFHNGSHLSRLSLKPYKPFAFKPPISFGKEYQKQATYSSGESLLVASSFFHKKKWTPVDPFQGQALFSWITFPPLKCLSNITKLLYSAGPFVKVVSHLSSPYLCLSEPCPVQTLFLTSRAEDTQYLMCGWTIDFWAFDLLFWLLMTAYFF